MWNFDGFEALKVFGRVRARYSLHHRLRPDRRGEGGRSHESGADDYILKDRLARLGSTVSRELERVRLFREQAAPSVKVRKAPAIWPRSWIISAKASFA